MRRRPPLVFRHYEATARVDAEEVLAVKLGAGAAAPSGELEGDDQHIRTEALRIEPDPLLEIGPLPQACLCERDRPQWD